MTRRSPRIFDDRPGYRRQPAQPAAPPSIQDANMERLQQQIRRSAEKARARAKRAQALTVGVWFCREEGWVDQPELVEACIRMFHAPSWPATLRFLYSQAFGGRSHPRRAGFIPKKYMGEVLPMLLRHEDLWEVTLLSAEDDAGGLARFSVGTRPSLDGHVMAMWGTRLSLGGDADKRWLLDMLALADTMQARNAVATVMPARGVMSDLSLCGISCDGVDQHPYPEQRSRMSRARHVLGRKHIRFPRWGTLLSHEHIAALGGLEKIQQHVQPALVAPCGAGLYFQLTDCVGTAMSADALAKQEKFIELAQPLLP